MASENDTTQASTSELITEKDSRKLVVKENLVICIDLMPIGETVRWNNVTYTLFRFIKILLICCLRNMKFNFWEDCESVGILGFADTVRWMLPMSKNMHGIIETLENLKVVKGKPPANFRLYDIIDGLFEFRIFQKSSPLRMLVIFLRPQCTLKTFIMESSLLSRAFTVDTLFVHEGSADDPVVEQMLQRLTCFENKEGYLLSTTIDSAYIENYLNFLMQHPCRRDPPQRTVRTHQFVKKPKSIESPEEPVDEQGDR